VRAFGEKMRKPRLSLWDRIGPGNADNIEAA
jgi:hypothetical protein